VSDVCALPSGISVPTCSIVTFVIMLPVKLATGRPIKAGSRPALGLHPKLRTHARRFLGANRPQDHAQQPSLGALAGVSITFNAAMSPALQM